MSVNGDNGAAPYLFYRSSPRIAPAPDLPDDCSLRIWRPGWRSIPPAIIRDTLHWIWWLFHVLHVFSTRDFGIVLIERDGELVHRTGVFPRYFRFPFLGRSDLQIGATWTAPAMRRRGLASIAIKTAREQLGGASRVFWYVVESHNLASIRVIERQAFTLVGRGRRVSRRGLRGLDYYAITEVAQPGMPHLTAS